MHHDWVPTSNVSASSANPNYYCSHVQDQSDATWASKDPGTGSWLSFNFQQQVRVSKILIKNHVCRTAIPDNIKFEVSNTGTDGWTTVDVIPGNQQLCTWTAH